MVTNLREIHQDLSHLVSSLSTAHVNDDVAIRELRQRLGDDGLAASEGAGNAHGTTLHTREQCIEDTLTDDKRPVGRQLLVGRTGDAYGPLVHHAELALGAVELELQDLLVDSVAALLGDAGDGSLGTGWEQDLVLAEETVLKDNTKNVAAGDVVADLELARCEVPLLLAVESGQVDTTGNVDAVGVVGDALEGTLDTVVDGLHETGAELDG